MSVNWDVKSITEDILDSHFETATEFDVDIYQKSEGDTGGAKISNRSSTHEIQIESTDDISIDRADITYSTQDKFAQVFITIKSESDKINIWQECINALNEQRKLPEYVWDRIEYEDLSIDDPSFGIHTSTIQIIFIKHSEPIQ